MWHPGHSHRERQADALMQAVMDEAARQAAEDEKAERLREACDL
jgi:hypothetical protein